MFDFAWSEIALIAAVALVVIGPKDLPVALRAISGFVKKARRMAGEFQTHVDEMMRDADLKDVKDSFNQIRNFDFRGTVEKAIDPDHSLRNTFAGNPLEPSTTSFGEAASADEVAGEVPLSEPAPDEHSPEPEPPPVRVDAPRSSRPLGAIRGRTERRRATAAFHSAGGHAPTPAGLIRHFRHKHEELPWPLLKTIRSTTSRCRCWTIWSSCARG
jgi:sec-independent protein translocase protein TatB